MRILICPDKFKGSLTALEVGEAIEKGLRKRYPDAQVWLHPMADGGDGSLDVLSRHLYLEQKTIATIDPLGRAMDAIYYRTADAAFIELSKASGLVLLQPAERNPEQTSTFGTGVLVKDALQSGIRNVFLFLGGSATNDAGMGIIAALGGRFLDKKGRMLAPIGAHLHQVNAIDRPAFPIGEVSITLLCDVRNPLFGSNGAAHVYARQKGATEPQVEALDGGLRHYAQVLEELTGVTVAHLPGAGAAGGIAASMVALLGARLENGFSTLSALTQLEAQIEQADWVISGEGSLDVQSLQGKLVDGVAALCRKYQKPLSLLVGKNELPEAVWQSAGISQVHAIAPIAKSQEDAMQQAARYLTEVAALVELGVDSRYIP